ncbi:SF1B family DNA helicase RecD2 [Capillimicrobium parvum]|uniref:ATP-dependent RecD2 DNA helicase n=1 Tax=Capillimicrobium parvum TaxID=2884022 RepID=A0A9E7C0T6_9ACTN|nr:ATP-dependent RecD-like DNA helicase [Capillimicrobium parvum]UGS36721.1 ATP-dependent RecD-like DNA helicase [Capillimicrobium parvum]
MTVPADPAPALAVEVARVRYQADDGDFAVLDAVTDDGEAVVVCGPLAHIHAGDAMEVRGTWREHPRHGRQFHVSAVRVAEPSTDAALLAVLAAVKHVGPAGAAYLLDRHGASVLDVVDADPHARLREVPGIGPIRIAPAVESWREARSLRAVRLFLDAHGVPAAAASRVLRALGADAVDVLTVDPYRLCELDGVGFATADALALALGVGPDDPRRLAAGVAHALREAESDGHCHLPAAELRARARRLLDADPAGAIEQLAAAGAVVVEGDRVADARLHRIEQRLAQRVRALLDADPAHDGPAPERPGGGAFVPTDAQWAAIQRALAGRLSILTGGPGVGKTATLRALVDVVHARRLSARLCAPTGKAARRMAEATGAEASTIHRLLGWQPGAGFVHGPEDPIPGADVLIVDEASMLDVRLAGALFGAVGDATHVVLVGDPDQLAPVGPGRVLDDLIASEEVPLTRLTEVFRQAARSLIVRAAHAINEGRPPPREIPGDVDRDFYFVARDRADEIFAEVVSLAADRLPGHLGLDPRADVQVLAPMHRGPVGIEALNDALRARLNPDGEPIPGTGLRVGDRVVQTRNDHERQLMNGEIGVIAAHDRDAAETLLATDDGRMIALPAGALETLRPAHAMSVHKAQGSSAPAVVVPIFSGHHVMLTRNLVYTALTRAERMAVFVGERRALELALRRVDARRRHTRLAELVREG